MKAPKWFAEQLAEEGGRIRERATTDEAAIAALASKVYKDDPGFTREIVANYVRRKLHAWLRQTVSADVSEAQLDLFPELPRRLEISPGRFADQAVMTGPDWDAALRQADTKAANANGFAEAVHRAYDKVRPLLHDDLTTAEVLRGSLDEEAL